MPLSPQIRAPLIPNYPCRTSADIWPAIAVLVLGIPERTVLGIKVVEDRDCRVRGVM